MTVETIEPNCNGHNRNLVRNSVSTLFGEHGAYSNSQGSKTSSFVFFVHSEKKAHFKQKKKKKLRQTQNSMS